MLSTDAVLIMLLQLAHNNCSLKTFYKNLAKKNYSILIL